MAVVNKLPGTFKHITVRQLVYKNRAKRWGGAFVKYILLIGLSFIIIFPLFAQVTSSFMTKEDLLDKTVKYFSRDPTLDNYAFVIKYTNYFKLLLNSVIVCMVCAILQTIFVSWIGYGFAKSKSKIVGILFAFVILTILVPPQLIRTPLFMMFRFPDFWEISQTLTGKAITGSLIDSIWPMVILSVTGLGLRCGLFIFMMRQFYKGLPAELSESAYVDGAGVYKTYFKIIFPLGKNLMLTIFILVFAWQWTDSFYSTVFFPNFKQLPSIISAVTNISDLNAMEGSLMSGLLINTANILVLLPILIIYVFAQKYMTEGIERSGIVG